MNINNLISDETKMLVYNQNSDLPLPPPPAHILALTNQCDTLIRTDSPYLMPPPPSITNTLIKISKVDNLSECNNDSIVPPPMPIINPPPRQSPVVSTSKTKSQNLSTFCTTAFTASIFTSTSSSVTSSLILPSSTVSQGACMSSVILNSNKLIKFSPPIAVPPRVSSYISNNKAINTTGSNEDNNKSLPPVQAMGNSATGSSINSGSSEISGSSSSSSRDLTYCIVCGQTHELSSNHIYSYRESVDTDLLCQLCHKPLVDPLETKCGHTFCTACLKSHLTVQALCPEDKQIINYLECCPASIIVKRLLDKLLVICPNREGCDEVMPRSELEAHILYWCRAIPPQVNNNNLCLGTAFQVSKSSSPNNKWDYGFEKNQNTNSTPVMTIITTNSGSIANNTYENSISVSSSSNDVNDTKNNINVSTRNTGANHHKNTVRFDAIPQTRKKNYSANDEHNFSSDSLTSITIDRSTNSDLGISFVGGSDTPLQCIVIQEIYLDGAVAKDGRLRPGDQIISINDIDLNHATHLQTRHSFLQAQQQSGISRFMIYRERAGDEFVFCEKEEILQFCLLKRAGKILGIKLVGQKNKPGLYVLDLVKGSEADLDGRLRKNDRILNINGVDLRLETQDTAARVINNAEDEVIIVISRIVRSQTPDLIKTTEPDLITEPFDSIYQTNSFSPPQRIGRKSNGTWYPSEKVVVVEKNYGESLGMSVAGGVNSQRGDTPVYVTNLTVDGIIAKTQQISKGDILLAVNDAELLGLSHEKAVETLKSAGQKYKKVSVRVLQGPETAKIRSPNFLPSWVYWLQLPRYCEIPRNISLKRDSATGSLGFSIVGGIDISHQNSSGICIMNNASIRSVSNPFHQPIVVKSIVIGSVAHRDGRLKCGDILLKINNISLINISHDDAVSIFKNVQDEVVLQVVSWPGTII